MAVDEQREHRWLGKSVARVEDERFVRGKGNYVDDIVLPGMLHMAILRSPAHARASSRSTPRARRRSRASSPSSPARCSRSTTRLDADLSGDTQAVLATDKVRMQGQEVACVVAETPYIAHDALELIDVDYEPLPAVTTPQQALEAVRRSSATTRKGRRTTGSTTGSRETWRRPTRPSPPRIASSAWRRTTRAAIPRRSSAAALPPTSTRRRGRRRST